MTVEIDVIDAGPRVADRSVVNPAAVTVEADVTAAIRSNTGCNPVAVTVEPDVMEAASSRVL